MKIYYYHTRPILPAWEEWKRHRHPEHILYGLTHFRKNGIECVLHPYRYFPSRLRLMFYTLWTVLRCPEPYDVLYGTSYRGLELIIFLRALGIYRKPIAIWHHQAIPCTTNWFKNQISKFFYKGLDCLFFFSQTLIQDSLQAKKFPARNMHLIHWGADLEFYDSLLEQKAETTAEFISTGKENRDFETLLQAFQGLSAHLDVYSPTANGDAHYENTLHKYQHCENITIHFVDGIIPYELAKKVMEAKIVVIPCLDLSYTVGLTTLVEALALGLPILSTRNPKFEIDIENEGAGLYTEYKDSSSWQKAISYLHENPDIAKQMGKQGRRLAEQTYNLENYTQEVSTILKSLTIKQPVS